MLPELTTDTVFERLTSAGKTAGGLDGWVPAELALVSRKTAAWIKELYRLVES